MTGLVAPRERATFAPARVSQHAAPLTEVREDMAAAADRTFNLWVRMIDTEERLAVSGYNRRKERLNAFLDTTLVDRSLGRNSVNFCSAASIRSRRL